MKDFLLRLRGELAGAGNYPPRLMVATDGPYVAHQRLGLNWATARAAAENLHPWMATGYHGQTAMGHLVDGVALGAWEPALTSVPRAEEAGFAWWASVEGIMATARPLRPGERGLLVMVVPARDNGWAGAVRAGAYLADGVVIAGVGELLRDAEAFELLALALGEPGG